ncbi:alpha/beta hydrolase [Nannocystis sp. RBIL2]|uniref:alpha/beta fold hydrolase n=1 Tax=Nannocystis sp. RBIL2 TaxID=2996788 RepID=UPI002271806E|nr:alpha/beta hydrolase [Nannocystis sp. RBIL2]MCY1067366.1 alpha/beta hydrolase [Nannocystis sp. RBIL2]
MSRPTPLILALAALTACADSSAATPAEPVDARFVASDGIDLHYVEYPGDGSPVVLLHGYTSTADATWQAPGIAQALAENHRVILLDQRGHGDSDKPHDPAAYGGRMLTDIVELMDHLDIDRAHIAGYSMGGNITAVLLNAAPERFITASLCGTGVAEADEALRTAAEALDPVGVDPEEIELLKMIEEGKIDAPVLDDAAMEALAVGWGQWGPPPVDLTDIEFPVLAVNGEFDRPYSKTVRMVRELPQFVSSVIPGRGHITTLIDPGFRDALVDFIEAHDDE